MPDTLSMTAGVSLGLLAGIVSGVCYIFANGLTVRQRSDRRKPCLPSPTEACSGCCRENDGDLPCVCSAHESTVKFEKGAWFLRQLQRAVSLMPWSFTSDKLEQIDEECEGRESPEGRVQSDLRSVREFLEALSAKLAGGPLEGTRVAPTYDHPAYNGMFERHHTAIRNSLSSLAIALRDALTHLPSRNESLAANAAPPNGASSAHAQLKRLVARVVEEAAALPSLARYAVEPPGRTNIEASTYEDLLATAILNKVIERYQTENGSGGRSSGIHSASASPSPSERSSPRSLNCHQNRDTTPPLHEEDEQGHSDWEDGVDDVIELPRRVPFPDFGGDIINGIEEGFKDFDEVSGSDIQAIDGSWEENWLFQKKKIKSLHSVPVPMLVPNSNTEYRAMIGDRDADDTTDLSDNVSDEEEDTAYKSDIKRVLDSKHVIGGKSKVDDIEILDFEPDSLDIIDGEIDNSLDNDINDAVNNEVKDTNLIAIDTVNRNLMNDIDNKESILIFDIDSGPLPKAEFSVKEIHRTLPNGVNDNAVDEINDFNHDGEEITAMKHDYQQNREFSQNTLKGHEREGEYEETVTVPVQRYADSLRRKHFDEVPQTISTRDTDKDELIPGSIADRERKKWLNYVEMPNNPYSPEAIQRRLSSKSTSSLFDIITKGKSIEDIHDKEITKDVVEIKETMDEVVNDEHLDKSDQASMNGDRSKSTSPKILQNVFAEEVPQYKRYGRDYYIKEAKASSGGRKKYSFSETSSLASMNKSTSLDNFDTEFASTGTLIDQFNSIATNQQYTNFANKTHAHQSITIISDSDNTHNILIEYDDVPIEQTLFAAKPVYLDDDDTDKKFDEIIQAAYSVDTTIQNTENDEADATSLISPTSLDQSFLSSSSLDDSIKVYNVQTGEVIKCKPVDNVSDRYDANVDSNDNSDITDKNETGNSEHLTEVHKDNMPVILEENNEEKFLDNTLTVIEEFDEITLPKVKELAKIFVIKDGINEEVKPRTTYSKRRQSKDNLDKTTGKQAYMHSLTARSISREFREELKQSMATPLKIPGGANEVPEGTEEVTKESSRPGSPQPEPGTLKTKLAFFESLKSKFSSK